VLGKKEKTINKMGVNRAIAYTEWFPNKLPCIFSREILKVVKQDYLP
jgi:hypothetical protein